MTLRLRAELPALQLDPKGELPLYRQLYGQCREMILSGQLRANAQLPSSRELARSLRVSRNTVQNALEQLIAEGYLQGKVGAGTFVSELPGDLVKRRLSPGETRPEPELSWEGQRALGYFAIPAPAQVLPFWSGVPALDKFPFSLWARLAASQFRKLRPAELLYADPAGHASLREHIAQYLRESRAVRCEADQILIVSGSQQALYLIARVLLNRDDVVVLEEPGYPGARHALAASGARLAAATVDGEGLVVNASLPKNAKAVYVTPSHQAPLGVTMTLARRLKLLEWSARTGAWIIEDDFDSEYRYTSRPLASLQGLAEHDQVLYVGTFSKVLFPGLRIGYLVLPKSLVRSFRVNRQILDFCPPILDQAVLARFLAEGHFARHIRRMRRVHRERQTVMIAALKKEFGDTLQITNTDSGLNLVVWLPSGISDVEAQHVAWKDGVFVFPMSTIFYTTPQTRSGLFLGFAGLSPAQIRAGARKLKLALAKLGL